MPVPTVPEWLQARGGSLKPGISDRTVYVMLGGQPQYRLDARPAGGRFVCNVIQTVSGRQLGDATAFESPDAALAGGLEKLRAKLGW